MTGIMKNRMNSKKTLETQECLYNLLKEELNHGEHYNNKKNKVTLFVIATCLNPI